MLEESDAAEAAVVAAADEAERTEQYAEDEDIAENSSKVLETCSPQTDKRRPLIDNVRAVCK